MAYTSVLLDVDEDEEKEKSADEGFGEEAEADTDLVARGPIRAMPGRPMPSQPYYNKVNT